MIRSRLIQALLISVLVHLVLFIWLHAREPLPRPTPAQLELTWVDGPQRRIARGQSVVLYAGDEVVAGGLVV